MKIYISSPVSHYQRKWNSLVTEKLRGSGFTVYLPQEIIQKSKSHKSFEIFVYEKCVEWIEDSDLGLLLLPYGRDCAWEVGYYRGLNKPLAILVDRLNKENLERLRDWMIKGSAEIVICLNKQVENILKKDPILSLKKIYIIDSVENLAFLTQEIIETYKNKDLHYVGAGAVVLKNDKVLMIKETKSSQKYNRQKGMWGFPTMSVKNNDPQKQALIALKNEAGITGLKPKFVSIQHIPRATGIFYKVEALKNQRTENGKWIDIRKVLNKQIYIRPTFDQVLLDTLKIYS